MLFGTWLFSIDTHDPVDIEGKMVHCFSLKQKAPGGGAASLAATVKAAKRASMEAKPETETGK